MTDRTDVDLSLFSELLQASGYLRAKLHAFFIIINLKSKLSRVRTYDIYYVSVTEMQKSNG